MFLKQKEGTCNCLLDYDAGFSEVRFTSICLRWTVQKLPSPTKRQNNSQYILIHFLSTTQYKFLSLSNSQTILYSVYVLWVYIVCFPGRTRREAECITTWTQWRETWLLSDRGWVSAGVLPPPQSLRPLSRHSSRASTAPHKVPHTSDLRFFLPSVFSYLKQVCVCACVCACVCVVGT